jgi:hypothetical protein
MRVGGNNDEKCGRYGKQTKRAKIATAWPHDFPFRRVWREAPWKLGFYRGKKIIQKPGWIGNSSGAAAQTGLSLRPAEECGKFVAANNDDAGRNYS